MENVHTILNTEMLKSRTRTHQILPKCYLVIDCKGLILKYNSKCKALLGLVDRKDKMQRFGSFLQGEQRERFDTLLHMVQLKGCIEDFELEITKSGGQRKIVWISASAAYDSDKNAIAMHCLLFDVSKEHMFLEQLREELGVYSIFFEKAPFGIAVKKNGEFIMANNTLSKLLGYPKPFLKNHYLHNATKNINVFDYDCSHWVQRTLSTKQNKKIPMWITKSAAPLDYGSTAEIFVFEPIDRHKGLENKYLQRA